VTRRKTKADLQPDRRGPAGGDEPAAAQLGPAGAGRPRKAQATFALRLDPAVVAELRRIAEVQAVGPTQLVRSWVLERLEIEHRGSSEPGSALIVARVLAALLPRVDEVVRQALAEDPRTVAPGGGTVT
jgi:hypothetical protein